MIMTIIKLSKVWVGLKSATHNMLFSVGVTLSRAIDITWKERWLAKTQALLCDEYQQRDYPE